MIFLNKSASSSPFFIPPKFARLPMKLLTNKIYLEVSELSDCGISINTIKKASERKSSSWEIMDHPDDGRKILVGYDNLRQDYKEKVIARYGNPYEFVAKGPIRNMVVADMAAE